MDRRLIAASRSAPTLCASDEECMHQGPTKQGLTEALAVYAFSTLPLLRFRSTVLHCMNFWSSEQQ